MLILILIDGQYSQKAVFSFEQGLNHQNHSSSCSLHLVKKSPPVKSPVFPHKEKFTPLHTPYCYLENPEKSCISTFVAYITISSSN